MGQSCGPLQPICIHDELFLVARHHGDVLHRSQGIPRLASVTVSNTSQPVSTLHLVHRIWHIGFTRPFADSSPLSPASLTCMSTRGLARMGTVSGNRSGRVTVENRQPNHPASTCCSMSRAVTASSRLVPVRPI